MSSGEEGTPMKHHKPASSVQEVPIVTAPHPDRPSSMQAYYGGAAPPTFYASTVVTSTPHPNMWAIQHHFMPSYGTPMPYPALFPPGEIFTHPTVPADPNLAPTNGEFGIKLSDRKERMSTKKTEGASGSTSIVVGKGTVSQKPSSSSGNGPNLCPESGVDGSSDASEDNTANHEPAAGKKRNIHQMLANGHIHPSDAVAPGAIVVHDGVMPDQWVHDERELKRQKRMQSNREAARRSRLRKQAECEQLQGRIDTLNNENHRLKEELQRLSEECEKVASENQSIKEELLRICGPDDLSRLEIILQEAGGDS